MKKLLSVLLMLQATSMFAITPPATPGENVWDLTARIGQELDEEIETGISFADVVESKVDNLDLIVENIVSCCDQTNGLLSGMATDVATSASGLDAMSSLVEVIQNTDLPRIESKVDQLASEVNLSLLDEFSGTWTQLHALNADISVVESIVDEIGADLGTLSSVVDVIATSDVPVMASVVDVADNTAEGVAFVCNQIASGFLPFVEFKVDNVDFVTDLLSSAIEVTSQTTLPRIESKIDAIDDELSVIDITSTEIESTLEYIESKVDILATATGSSGAPCDGKSIKQTDFVAGLYSTSIDGYYCLAEDVTGTITVSDDTTIDLNNHTITGQILVAGASRIVVRNGRIVATLATGPAINFITVSDVVVQDIQIAVNDATIDGVVLNSASNIIIRQCAITSTADNSACVRVGTGSSNIQILESTLIGGSEGVVVESSGSGNTVNKVLVQDCMITKALSVTVGSGNGILMTNGDVFNSSNADDLQVVNTSIIGCSGNGIRILGNDQVINCVVVSGCTIADNLLSGIAATKVKDLSVLNCVINKNGTVGGVGIYDGIQLVNVTNTYIARNTINSNVNNGISLAVAGAGLCNRGAIEYNTLENNAPTGSGFGIQLGGAGGAVTNYSIEKNDLMNLGNIGLTLPGDADSNTIVANKAHTTAGGFNYYDNTGGAEVATAFPIITFTRSTNTTTDNTGGVAVTGWHNWSSLP